MIFRIFICILHHLRAVPCITDEPTKDPAPSWLDTLVGRALHRYHKGHGFESFEGLNCFFSWLLFHNCLSCVHNCDNKSCLHIFLGDSIVWSFINSFVCDSVIPNRCRMQGKCVVGESSSTTRLGESNPLYSSIQCLYLDETRPGKRRALNIHAEKLTESN